MAGSVKGRARRNKQRKRFPEFVMPGKQVAWVPTDCEFDEKRLSALMQEMELCIREVECSRFYQKFVKQIESPELSDRFHKALASELTMKMVIYGIGSIESSDRSRFQLSLAILMKRKFNWIGEIEVFDPILSTTEILVIEALGCFVLNVNEECRRRATKPTLFFMPGCIVYLLNNLLKENWDFRSLNHVVLLGNSLEKYVSSLETHSQILDWGRHVVAAQRFKEEHAIRIDRDDGYYEVFRRLSWQFSTPVMKQSCNCLKFD